MITYIDRPETIKRFKKEHEQFFTLVSSLSEKTVQKPNTLGNWSVKDIVAHLAAWNWEVLDEAIRILNNQASWPDRYEGNKGEDEFNKKGIARRKNMSWKEVLKDWDDSFWAEIKQMENFSESEWRHQSDTQCWADGSPVTVYSLYAYEYEGEGHEGGHGKQILKKFTT